MTDAKTPRNLSTTALEAADEAREQANEYDSMFGDTPLDIGNGEVIMIPPHPDYGMLPDDRLDEYEKLLFEVDTEYDREPDVVIPDQKLKDDNGKETGVVVPGETMRGALKRPFRKDGVRVTPSHTVRIAQIALGEADYKRLVDAGKGAKDVWAIWSKQSYRIQERKQRDSKSV
jgi:hypothetical protein